MSGFNGPPCGGTRRTRRKPLREVRGTTRSKGPAATPWTRDSRDPQGEAMADRGDGMKTGEGRPTATGVTVGHRSSQWFGRSSTKNPMTEDVRRPEAAEERGVGCEAAPPLAGRGAAEEAGHVRRAHAHEDLEHEVVREPCRCLRIFHLLPQGRCADQAFSG
ncbi:uncharacterized protein LOC112268782 [Brachypodium distachyon]|uniref:Uncharacterized protein n=1 Tax=Brachypodium distachyon TaxID=15368 RepID=A0A2K2CPP2_BRADI|nr:uncharacterized protein LOC112268782 [Brachypodium distachyon]PNT64007.1 hypothetical protein BRADI_4g23389v3 [Brachypodium distachyon]|eukprot:XP_024310659.1 uncharacterized protein LOC112268782 [Brachypodium distachyon]